MNTRGDSVLGPARIAHRRQPRDLVAPTKAASATVARAESPKASRRANEPAHERRTPPIFHTLWRVGNDAQHHRTRSQSEHQGHHDAKPTCCWISTPKASSPQTPETTTSLDSATSRHRHAVAHVAVRAKGGERQREIDKARVDHAQVLPRWRTFLGRHREVRRSLPVASCLVDVKDSWNRTSERDHVALSSHRAADDPGKVSLRGCGLASASWPWKKPAHGHYLRRGALPLLRAARRRRNVEVDLAVVGNRVTQLAPPPTAKSVRCSP